MSSQRTLTAPPPVTPYQARVYEVLRRIPRGRVTTYGRLAAAAGGSARAVGQALRVNPLAPEVPCHRVVRADGAIGGFQGRSGGAAVARKRALLRAEGVTFTRGRLDDPERIVAP